MFNCYILTSAPLNTVQNVVLLMKDFNLRLDWALIMGFQAMCLLSANSILQPVIKIAPNRALDIHI